MSISSIAPVAPISTLIEPNALQAKPNAQPTAEDLRKAASQFEAILVRQLLGPTMNSLLSAGASGSGGVGSDVYGYMLTDVFSNALASGQGLGLSNIIELQLGVPADPDAPQKS